MQPPVPAPLRLNTDNPLESSIEGKVCKHARDLGFYVRKFVSPANRSVPDRLFITPGGLVFFIEFKRKGKKPTPDQVREHQEIRDHNTAVHVIDNVEDGKKLIGSYCNAFS